MSTSPTEGVGTAPSRSTVDLTLPAAVAAVLVGLAVELLRGGVLSVALALILGATIVTFGCLVLSVGSRWVALGEDRLRNVVRLGVAIQVIAFVPLLNDAVLDDAGQPGATVARLAVLVIVVLAVDQLRTSPATGAWGRAGLLAAVAVLGWLWIRNNPPYIDVFEFQRLGANRLLAGVNPYAFGYPDIYSPVYNQVLYGPGLVVGGTLQFGFPYPPVSLLAVLPGALLGDVRYMHLAALLAAGWLLLTMVKDSWSSRAGGVLLLTTPMLLRMVELSFTESFLVVALIAAVWVWRRGSGATVVALGLLLAVKQYAVLFLPVLLWVTPAVRTARQRWRVTWQAVAVAAVVTVPLAVWSLREFIFSVGILQFRQPYRPDSLSVLAWAVNHWQWPTPGWFLPILVVATAAAMWWALARAPRTWAGTAVGVAVVQLGFVLVSKQAFTNYYFFALGALCLAVALRDDDVRVDGEDEAVWGPASATAGSEDDGAPRPSTAVIVR